MIRRFLSDASTATLFTLVFWVAPIEGDHRWRALAVASGFLAAAASLLWAYWRFVRLDSDYRRFGRRMRRRQDVLHDAMALSAGAGALFVGVGLLGGESTVGHFGVGMAVCGGRRVLGAYFDHVAVRLVLWLKKPQQSDGGDTQ